MWFFPFYRIFALFNGSISSTKGGLSIVVDVVEATVVELLDEVDMMEDVDGRLIKLSSTGPETLPLL